MIGSTQASIVNRALQQIAGQAMVTGTAPNFGGPSSAASLAAGVLYVGVVQTLLRDLDPEFARTTAALTAAGGTPAPPWAFQYLYPTDCAKVRQVLPATWNANDPQPVRWSVADASIGSPGTPTRVILANQSGADLVYTTTNVTEAQWDPMFEETAVRLLASELAMAIGGRPDFSQKMLESSGKIGASGTDRDS